MRHGCVAVLNGRIIGRGYNHHRSHSNDGFVHNCVTCHAEMSALRQAYHHFNLRGDFRSRLKGRQQKGRYEEVPKGCIIRGSNQRARRLSGIGAVC